MASAKARREQFCLRAFADAGRAEQHQPLGIYGALRRYEALRFATFKPRVAIVFSSFHAIVKFRRVSDCSPLQARSARPNFASSSEIKRSRQRVDCCLLNIF